MKSLRLIISIFFVSFVLLQAAASASSSDIAVQSHEINPSVLMFGDEATVKITVKNTGSDFVLIKSVIMYVDSEEMHIIDIIENPNQMIGDIGSTHTRDFTFTIKAFGRSGSFGQEGIYYPEMVMSYGGDSSYPLRYQVPVKIEDTPLIVSIKDKPEVFTKGKEETVNVIVGNPRENSVSAVRLTPLGTGFTVSPESYFIGELNADSSTTVSFDITPEEGGEIVFRADYRNGMNEHESETVLDVNFGESKTNPWMILNNLEVTPGMPYRLEGDVYNAGIDEAKSVVVTSGYPAEPLDPYRSYVAGALEPDDFMDFEITFDPGNATELPVLIQYKDVDGNSYEEKVEIDLESLSAGGDGENNTAGDGGILIPLVIFVVVIAALAFILHRSGHLSRASAYLHRRIKR